MNNFRIGYKKLSTSGAQTNSGAIINSRLPQQAKKAGKQGKLSKHN
ncbi:MAG: hypothetical protein LBH16_05430 [Treponema sp.]|nr:hypothetical protein [Treponema sp.]